MIPRWRAVVTPGIRNAVRWQHQGALSSGAQVRPSFEVDEPLVPDDFLPATGATPGFGESSTFVPNSRPLNVHAPSPVRGGVNSDRLRLTLHTAQSLRELNHLLDNNSAQVDAILVSTALVRAAKLLPDQPQDFKGRDKGGASQFIDRAVTLASEELGNFGYRQAANSMWALAKLRAWWPRHVSIRPQSRDGKEGGSSSIKGALQPRDLVVRMLHHSLQQLPEATWQEVTQVLWACGQLGVREHGSLRQVAMFITQNSPLPPGYSPKGGPAPPAAGSQATRAGQQDREVPAARQQESALGAMRAVDCAILLTSCAKMEYKNVHLLHHVCCHLHHILQQDIAALQTRREAELADRQQRASLPPYPDPALADVEAPTEATLPPVPDPAVTPSPMAAKGHSQYATPAAMAGPGVSMQQLIMQGGEEDAPSTRQGREPSSGSAPSRERSSSGGASPLQHVHAGYSPDVSGRPTNDEEAARAAAESDLVGSRRAYRESGLASDDASGSAGDGRTGIHIAHQPFLYRKLMNDMYVRNKFQQQLRGDQPWRGETAVDLVRISERRGGEFQAREAGSWMSGVIAIPRKEAVGRVGMSNIKLDRVIAEALGLTHAEAATWLQAHYPQVERLLGEDFELYNLPRRDGGSASDVPSGGGMATSGPKLSKEEARAITATVRTHMAVPPEEAELQGDMGLHDRFAVNCLQMCNVLWALGKLRYNKHPVLAALAFVICERQSELSGREVANCLWAAGQLYLTHGGLYDALLAQALHHLRTDSPELQPQHLGQIAGGLAACEKLGKVDLPVVQRELAAATIRAGDGAPLRVLCNVVSGLGSSRHLDVPLIEHVAARVMTSSESLTPLDALSILGPLAQQWNFRPGQWYDQRLYDRLVGVLEMAAASLEPRQRSNALWALGTAGHYHPALFTRLLRDMAVGEQPRRATERLVCANQAIQGLSRLGVVPDKDALAQLKASVFSDIREWPDALIPSLACSLAILEELTPDEADAIYQELLTRVHGRGIALAKGQDVENLPLSGLELTPPQYAQLYQAHMIVEAQHKQRLLPRVLVRKGRDMWKQLACASTISESQEDVRRHVLGLNLREVDIHEEYMAQGGLFALDIAILERPSVQSWYQGTHDALDGRQQLQAGGQSCGDEAGPSVERRPARVAVEFHGHQHYHRNSGLERGWTRVRRQLLRMHGWELVEISHKDWESSNKRDYLLGELRRVLPAHCFSQ